jgi:hypothetical protein
MEYEGRMLGTGLAEDTAMKDIPLACVDSSRRGDVSPNSDQRSHFRTEYRGKKR